MKARPKVGQAIDLETVHLGFYKLYLHKSSYNHPMCH